MGQSQSLYGYSNMLLSEPQATHGVWRNPANVEFALMELEDRIYLDRNTVIEKLKELNDRVLNAYRQHFKDDFRPGEPLKQSRQLVSMYLPELAQRLYLVCRLHDVQA
jgi:hypothetical protein